MASLSDITVTLPNGHSISAHEHVLVSGGDAPGSVFGTYVEDWAPAAVAYFDLLVASSADNSEHLLDEAMSVIVNAHSIGGVAAMLSNSDLGQRVLANL